MKKYVEYCENSTITEAWSVIIGTPGEVRESDVGALENIASKSLGDFQAQPTFIVLQNKKDDKIVPSFWHKQLSYENGKYITRLGHRYLSVHFIKNDAARYNKYEYSLEPQVNMWLDSYAEMVRGRKIPDHIEKIGFGYVNVFKLPLKNFDLSQYFKINFGTGVESAKEGLGTLEIKFKLNYNENNSAVEITISVIPESSESNQIDIITKVVAFKTIEENCSFEEKDKILEIISDVKHAAKSVFFDLATKETHNIMGAKYDSVTT